MPKTKRTKVEVTKAKARALPTLAECEKALGEKAETWVARCYEISSRIVQSGLVEGEAVYGHWLGPIHSASTVAHRRGFAHRRGLPFIQHGWVLLEYGRVLDPTRWAFEARLPYLYIGSPPDAWDITPCKNCGLLKGEHDCNLDDCGCYETEKWPYDEGGNQWRNATRGPAPVPKPNEPLLHFQVSSYVAVVVAALLGQTDGTKLTSEQIFWLANLPYEVLVSSRAVKEIYEAICGVDTTFAAFIPIDNRGRAGREFGFVL